MNIIEHAAREIENHNKYRQYRQIKNRDKIVLLGKTWGCNTVMELQMQGAYEGKRFIGDVTKLVKLRIYKWKEIIEIDPVQKVATFIADLYPSFDWRLNQFLPNGTYLRWEKYNRHTPGQHVIKGSNGVSLLHKGLRIFADGTLDPNTIEQPIMVQPDQDWLPFIRRTLKTLRKLSEPYEPWRAICDQDHSTFGREAMRERAATPAAWRVENVLQWATEGDNFADTMGAYADLISLGTRYWWRPQLYYKSEHCFKRALLARMCSKPVV